MKMDKFYKLSLSEMIRINIVVDLLFLLFGQVTCDYLSVLNITLFIPDIFNVITFVFLITDKLRLHIKHYISISILFMFVLYTFLSFAWSNGALLNGIVRFRYIVAGFWIFYCCVNYIDTKLLKKITSILYISLWIHTILIFYQFFIMRTGVDTTNGLFGFIEYNNAAQGIYCLAIALMGVVCYLFDITPKFKSTIIIILPCITCALSEIKTFYIEFFISSFVVILYCMKNKKRRNRILSILLLIIIGVVVAYKILEQVMPQNLYAFKSVTSFLYYESYETGRAGGYGRYSQLQWVFERIFNNELIISILGMGISFKKDIIVYEASKTFANFGMIGLFLLCSFYIYNIFFLNKKKPESPFTALSIGFSVVELLSIFMWNATLNRMSYLGFIIISLGYIDFKMEFILIGKKSKRFVLKQNK